MNHQDAVHKNASDRYLLGELDGTERDEFEEHFFTCVDCAEDVRAGAALARGVKAVYGSESRGREAVPAESGARGWLGWFDWLSPAALVPAGAALVLAVLAGYQNLVVIPALKQGFATAAVTATYLKSAARGEESARVEVQSSPVSVLAMDINGVEPGAKVGYELSAPDGSVRVSGAAQAPSSGQPLLLVVRDSDLRAPGTWTVVVRTSSGAELGRYPFLVQLK